MAVPGAKVALTATADVIITLAIVAKRLVNNPRRLILRGSLWQAPAVPVCHLCLRQFLLRWPGLLRIEGVHFILSHKRLSLLRRRHRDHPAHHRVKAATALGQSHWLLGRFDLGNLEVSRPGDVYQLLGSQPFVPNIPGKQQRPAHIIVHSLLGNNMRALLPPTRHGHRRVRYMPYYLFEIHPRIGCHHLVALCGNKLTERIRCPLLCRRAGFHHVRPLGPLRRPCHRQHRGKTQRPHNPDCILPGGVNRRLLSVTRKQTQQHVRTLRDVNHG
mmetsp:Transcript_1952/g.6363  ORF Transcript_1952/g.6363 Transcript_1952/m.6363 type:complete len:273 (+) Transcript_1952:1202-2020(+)